VTVILAVPAFLFYNWWVNKQAAKAKEISRAPAKNVFPDSSSNEEMTVQSSDLPSPDNVKEEDMLKENMAEENTERLAGGDAALNASALNQADTPPAEPSGIAENPSGVADENREGDSGDLPRIGVSSGSYSANQSTSPVNVSTSVAQTENLETTESTGIFKSRFSPKSNRDPTLSPKEYAKIRYEIERKKALERQKRLEELRRKQRANAPPKFDFQGIIGRNIILDGEMYKAGSVVKGVKILKVGSNYFIGYYKGRKFKRYLK